MATSSTQNISDFYTQAQHKDFARQHQFRVVQLANTNLSPDDFVYMTAGVLPGRAIHNIAVPFMGLQFNVPGTAHYPGSDGWQVTFRCDSNYNIRHTLEAATFLTFDDSSSTGDYNIARQSSVITLDLLNKANQPIRRYNLIGAYVVSVADIAYDSTNQGDVVMLPTTLAYQYWRLDGVSMVNGKNNTIPSSTGTATSTSTIPSN